jgi:hypothetical protein
MDLKTMAPISWNENSPLLAGPVRAYQDNVAGQIVIETTKFHPAGSGLEICRLEFGRAREARAILALADLLRGGQAFVPLGKKLEEADPDAPLITDTAIKLEITVGDVQRIAGACVKAFPPVVEIPPGARIKRGSGRKLRPKPGR